MFYQSRLSHTRLCLNLISSIQLTRWSSMVMLQGICHRGRLGHGGWVQSGYISFSEGIYIRASLNYSNRRNQYIYNLLYTVHPQARALHRLERPASHSSNNLVSITSKVWLTVPGFQKKELDSWVHLQLNVLNVLGFRFV